MRRWLALLAGVAAIALTGTALALTGPEVIGDEETATETTVKTETTTTTIEEPVKAEHFVFDDFERDDVEKDEVEWEAPEKSIPTEPRDHIPLEIAILHPEDGQIFEHSEVVFEGSSEPGSAVFVGEKRADVGDDGSWRIVLNLAAGENHVTAKSVSEYGQHATDSVTVIYRAPEPKEEPRREEPIKEEPREEEPKEHPVEWEFSAYQVYGECSENPPYDVFYGSGKPGSVIHVLSEYGSGSREINEHGEWEIKVIFESAVVGHTFAVKVKDEFGHKQVFEFTRTD